MTFRVGLDANFNRPDEPPGYGHVDLSALDRADLDCTVLEPYVAGRLTAEHVRGCDAVFLRGDARVTAQVVAGADRLTLIAMFHAGLDLVDVPACTERGVLVTNSSDACVPIAHGAIALLLALAHNQPELERIGRTPGWPGRSEVVPAAGVIGRTLGIVGLGTIGREVARVAVALGMRVVAYTPRLTPERAAASSAEAMDLDELLAESDFVCLAVGLTTGTKALIDGRRIALMKPTAYLINVGRGATVDEPALVEALSKRRLAGAGLDVIAREPIEEGNPLLELDNVILSAHRLGVTQQRWDGMAESGIRSILAVREGRVPEMLVNPEVVDRAGVRERLAIYASQ